MYGRAGLNRFKKAQSLQPFSVNVNSSPGSATATQTASRAPLLSNSSAKNPHPQTPYTQARDLAQVHVSQKPAVLEAAPLLGIPSNPGCDTAWWGSNHLAAARLGN